MKIALPSDGRYGAAATAKQHRRFNLAVVTLRTVASDLRTNAEKWQAQISAKGQTIAVDPQRLFETFAVMHALIAQELAQLGEPNTTPTQQEIDAL